MIPGVCWALPSLQLGPGDDASWNYVGGGDDTWYVSDSAFTLGAYANALGGNGDYAFTDTNTTRTAYLVFSASPKHSDAPGGEFDLTVMDEHGALTLVQHGYGSPPDPGAGNDGLGSHGIYDTYFYVYEFDFDGDAMEIQNQEPGNTGSGLGYAEMLSVTVNGTGPAVEGIHVDLFTVNGDGKLVTTDGNGNPLPPGDLDNQLLAVAPFSHDAQFLQVPEPGTLGLLLGAVFGFGWVVRRPAR